MAPYTLSLRYLVVVPVGHRVRLDYFRRDLGLFGSRMQDDPENPNVVDLETGVVWRSGRFASAKSERGPSYFARVLACDVETIWGSTAHATSVLTFEPIEAPRG